ncbi:MAG: nucleoside 2-deoxyribosyltransferase [Pyrinomonadaceae bacterium]
MASGKGQKKIYFAGAIRGGRDDAVIYFEIVRRLAKYGQVLTEHIGDSALTADGETADDQLTHDRDLEWLRESELLVAEVTVPSLGVGYEIGKATEWGKPVLCLYRPQAGRALSAMIAGSKGVVLKEYESTNQLEEIFSKFFGH